MDRFAAYDVVEIVRGLVRGERTISKVYSNGSLLLNEDFLGRKKVILSADYTTKGFRRGYLG